MSLLAPGAAAPQFSLYNQDKSLISLDDYVSKWVVTYFYPKALTSGCTLQACGVRDKKAVWEGLNAHILGISPDTPGQLKKFAEAEGLNFPLLSDSDHATAEAYGTWQQKSMYGRTYMGVARVTYIIDPKGVIAHVISKVNPKTHADEVKEWLKQHQ